MQETFECWDEDISKLLGISVVRWIKVLFHFHVGFKVDENDSHDMALSMHSCGQAVISSRSVLDFRRLKWLLRCRGDRPRVPRSCVRPTRKLLLKWQLLPVVAGTLTARWTPPGLRGAHRGGSDPSTRAPGKSLGSSVFFWCRMSRMDWPNMTRHCRTADLVAMASHWLWLSFGFRLKCWNGGQIFQSRHKISSHCPLFAARAKRSSKSLRNWERLQVLFCTKCAVWVQVSSKEFGSICTLKVRNTPTFLKPQAVAPKTFSYGKWLGLSISANLHVSCSSNHFWLCLQKLCIIHPAWTLGLVTKALGTLVTCAMVRKNYGSQGSNFVNRVWIESSPGVGTSTPGLSTSCTALLTKFWETTRHDMKLMKLMKLVELPWAHDSPGRTVAPPNEPPIRWRCLPPSRPFQCKSVCPCQHVLHIIQCNPVKRLWSCFLMSYTSYFHSGGCFTSFGGWQGRHQPEGHVALFMTQIELWEELLNPIRLSQVVSIKRLIYARFISYPIFLLILFISDMCFFSPGADGAMCSQPDFEVPRRRFWNYTFGHFMSFCIL